MYQVHTVAFPKISCMTHHQIFTTGVNSDRLLLTLSFPSFLSFFFYLYVVNCIACALMSGPAHLLYPNDYFNNLKLTFARDNLRENILFSNMLINVSVQCSTTTTSLSPPLLQPSTNDNNKRH
jgi:hypothetical protein